jgi:hypothetical protein
VVVWSYWVDFICCIRPSEIYSTNKLEKSKKVNGDSVNNISSGSIKAMRTILLLLLVGSNRNILFVLLQQDMSKLFTGKVRRRDIVLLGFQPFDDCFGDLFIRLLAFRVKVGQYLVQTNNSNLCPISKP